MFVNTNGAGLGHLNRCLAYARTLSSEVTPVFFTLSSAVDVIHDFGFDADYFVSHFWSASGSEAWNRELAYRMTLMLRAVRPVAVVFDGTIPFRGLVEACRQFDDIPFIWSRRGSNRPDARPVPVDEDFCDLLLEPGEIGDEYRVISEREDYRRVALEPVTLLAADELLSREAARTELGLAPDEQYALFSLGSGNQKDTREIASGLAAGLIERDVKAVWAQPPIAIREPLLPPQVERIRCYPLARYLRAFDLFVGAAGYNSCCELLLAGIPALLVPNRQLTTDDQLRRARHLATTLPVVVSDCEGPETRVRAIQDVLALSCADAGQYPSLDGARQAAREIMQCVEKRDG
nr:glycosyltransferase [Natronospira proteinivora]